MPELTKQPLTSRSNKQAEVAVLGAVLIDPTVYAKAAQYIKSEKFFYNVVHQRIWLVLAEMIFKSKPIDLVTLCDELRPEIETGKISLAYLSSLPDSIPSSSHCEQYAKIVAVEYQARELMKNYNTAYELLAERSEPTEVWQTVNQKTSNLFIQEEKPYSIHDLMEDLEHVDASGDWGLRWGLEALDETIGQFSRGSVIVLGGRPGHFKTTLAVQLIDNWVAMNHRVFFQSMEMTRKEIDMRRLSRFSAIPLWRIKKGPNYYQNAEDDDYLRHLHNAAAKVHAMEKRLFVSETSGLTPEEICLNIRMAYDLHGINIFVLDHFHRVNFSRGAREMRHSQEQGLEMILATCKNNNITPLILSQLNRSIEHTDGEREPRLSDLRECGRLEEAATNVLMMYWHFKKTQNPVDKFEMKILNAKSRDGSTGRIFLKVNPDVFSFGGRILK